MGPNANSTNATPFSFLCQFSHKSGMRQLSGKPAAVVSVPTTQPASQPSLLAQHRERSSSSSAQTAPDHHPHYHSLLSSAEAGMME